MYRFYIGNGRIEEPLIYLTGGDVNHIKNVLRMKCGEKVIVCNTKGIDYYCKIKQIAEEIQLEIEEMTESKTELPTKITLFQGLPKKDKMELIIQKAVELGAFSIVPVITKRTIVKLEDKKKEQKKLERWQAIAESAAKQSSRGIIPKILPIVSFKEALTQAKELDFTIIPYELAQGMIATKNCIEEIKKTQSAGIFIGPEGGFEAEEIEHAKQIGAVPISLGKRILRTETAGLTILSILMYELDQ